MTAAEGIGVKLSGFVGSIVGAFLGRSNRPLKPLPFLAAVMSGAAVAEYGSPALVLIWPDLVQAYGSVSFFVGMFGVAICGRLLARIPRFIDSVADDIGKRITHAE